jgi:AcrR family transcriptional regulator
MTRERRRKLSTHPVRKQGRETRSRMLQELSNQLRTRSIRDVTITEIAEAAGVTAAAFYQYFTDLQGAILALADTAILDARSLSELVMGDWDEDGEVIARRLVDRFLEFWERHEGVLRVIELAIDAKESQFNRIRQAILSETTVALSMTIAGLKRTGRYRVDVAPREMAAALLAIPVHVSSRLWLYELWGLNVEDMKRSMTDVMVTVVTGRGLAVEPPAKAAQSRRATVRSG